MRWDCVRILEVKLRVRETDIFQSAGDVVTAKILCEHDIESGAYQAWVEEIHAKEILEA